jgi:hypothetical protein
MRTTLDLPEKLLSDAMKMSHIRTKTSVIIRALEDLVQKSKIAGIKDYHGRLRLNIDLDGLRQR